jgi:hypothetical protein
MRTEPPSKKHPALTGQYPCTTRKTMRPSLEEAIDDASSMKNLHGPFDSAEEAIAYALKE